MAGNFIGTSGWSYDHWANQFYPKDLNKNRWLEFYTENLDSVELNASFYRLPKKKTFENWWERTPDCFTFSVKMSRYVTHVKRLLDPEDSLKVFFDAVGGLGEKCSTVLIQLPPSLGFETGRVNTFLEELTVKYGDYRFTFECRHQSWFNDGVYDLLRRYGIALCISDTPCYPYSEEVTSGFVYVRLHGHEQLYASDYSDQQLREWADKIRAWNIGGKDVFIYFDNDANAYAVKNALRLRELLE